MDRRSVIKNAGLAGVLAAGAAPALVHAQANIRWRLTSGFPKALDTIYGAASRTRAQQTGQRWPLARLGVKKCGRIGPKAIAQGAPETAIHGALGLAAKRQHRQGHPQVEPALGIEQGQAAAPVEGKPMHLDVGAGGDAVCQALALHGREGQRTCVGLVREVQPRPQRALVHPLGGAKQKAIKRACQVVGRRPGGAAVQPQGVVSVCSSVHGGASDGA